MSNQEQLEKSFAAADSMTSKFWDMWMLGLGTLIWTQEQMESISRRYLDQNKAGRDENVKIVEEMMKQVKNNQTQMNNMIHEAVSSAMENIKIPSYTYFEDLSRKVDDLAKKVENL